MPSKFGAWLRDNRDANATDANFNGSFSFPSLQAYVATLNGLAQGQTFAQIAAACPASQNRRVPAQQFDLHHG